LTNSEVFVPTYSYACTDCDNRFDAVQAFTDDALTTCAKCSGKLRKLFGSVGVVFKGSGFYRTDNRESAKSKSNGSSANGESSSSSSSDASTSATKSTSDSSSASSSNSSSAASASSSAKSAPAAASS
jgi:putative FmdB family regulatory protein